MPQATGTPRTRRRRSGLWFVIPAAFLVSSGLVYQTSDAAFTATAPTGTNTWTTGSVVLTLNTSSNVVFNFGNLKASESQEKCIDVHYDGSLNANVKVYVTSVAESGTAGLASKLDIKIEEMNQGTTTSLSGNTCPTVAAELASGTISDLTSALSPKTLANAGTTHGTYGNGLSSWAPTTSSYKRYRITTTVAADAPQGATVKAVFTWEARQA